MFFRNFVIAGQSLKHKKTRSFLTILGIIFGIGAITLLISLEQGLKKVILNDKVLQDDLITIRSGNPIVKNETDNIITYNFSQTINALPVLTQSDLQIVEAMSQTKKIAPVIEIKDSIQNNTGQQFQNGHIIATNNNLFNFIDFEVERQQAILDSKKLTVIIGDQVAKELLKTSEALGMEIVINNQTLIVGDVLKEPSDLNPFNLSFNYRRAVLIPFASLDQIYEETPKIYEILIEVEDKTRISSTIKIIEEQLLNNHFQKKDFSVFKNNELLFLTDSLFKIGQNFIIVFSLIFLTISGISLMNAMLVAVKEKEEEIFIRKSVGATNRQIFVQFLIEALVLSFIGGLIGLVLALGVSLVIENLTILELVTTKETILLMTIVSIGVGTVFGFSPALMAANQKTRQMSFD